MGKGRQTAEHYVGPEHVGDEVICVDHLVYRYPDGTLALEDVSLHVQAGSTLAIVGPNGAGKTTLLKVMLGLLTGYDGTVRIAGVTPAEARAAGNVMGWVPQRARMVWDFPVTVEQVVRMGLVGRTHGLLGRYRREDLAYVAELMDVLEIRRIAQRPIGEVSGGQQQRAIIARALAPRPKVLLLDEPTVGVDPAGVERFGELMERIKQAYGVTLVVVSHDLRNFAAHCERLACLNRTLHFHDTPSQLRAEDLESVFRCKLTGIFPVQDLPPACVERPAEGEEGAA